MIGVVTLMSIAGCDDTLFPAAEHGSAVVGDSYEDVVTIFDASCNSCHSAAGQAGGLDLETDACTALIEVASPEYGALLVVPGASADSVLWHKVANTETYGGVMPPGVAIAAESVDTIAAWIDAGADCVAGGN